MKLIVREPLGYAVTLTGIVPVLTLMIGASVVAEIVNQAVGLPFLPGFIGKIASFIPAIVIARILGLYLWHHEHELGLA